MRWVATVALVIALAATVWVVRQYVFERYSTDTETAKDSAKDVVFYTQCDYKGAGTALPLGRYTVGTLLLLGLDHDWNGSSLKIPHGVQVTIVAMDGTVHKLDADTPCFGSRVLPLLDAYVVRSVRILRSSD